MTTAYDLGFAFAKSQTADYPKIPYAVDESKQYGEAAGEFLDGFDDAREDHVSLNKFYDREP